MVAKLPEFITGNPPIGEAKRNAELLNLKSVADILHVIDGDLTSNRYRIIRLLMPAGTRL